MEVFRRALRSKAECPINITRRLLYEIDRISEEAAAVISHILPAIWPVLSPADVEDLLTMPWKPDRRPRRHPAVPDIPATAAVFAAINNGSHVAWWEDLPGRLPKAYKGYQLQPLVLSDRITNVIIFHRDIYEVWGGGSRSPYPDSFEIIRVADVFYTVRQKTSIDLKWVKILDGDERWRFAKKLVKAMFKFRDRQDKAAMEVLERAT